MFGIDPGSYVTGWGVVQCEGSKLHGVAAGTLQVGKTLPLSERLCILHQGLCGLMDEHAPEAIAVESIFFAKHANAALKLGHVRGVALLAAAQCGRAIHEYPPATVKKAVGGKGNADKSQVARFVGALLGWRDLPALDATDALAVAITHAQAAPYLGRLRRSVGCSDSVVRRDR